MELEILRMLIEKRNNKLDEDYKKTPAYDYLVDAKENLNDNEKMLVSYLNISTNKPIEECTEIIRSIGINNLKLTDSELGLLVNLLVYFKCTASFTEVKNYLLETNPFKSIKAWNKIDLERGDKTLVMRVSDISKKYKMDLSKLISLLEENPRAFIDICSLAIDLKYKTNDYTIARAKRELYSRILNTNENYNLFNKKYKPTSPSIEEAKSKIKRHVEEMLEEERNYYKLSKLEQYHNENALKLLEKELQKPEITNVRPLIKKIVDQQIKEIILAIVYKHNLNYAKGLNQEYNQLMSNSTTRYLSLLNEYGITIQEEALEDITNNSIEDLTEILTNLKSMISSELYLLVLNITNKETVIELKEFLTKGYISKTVLTENLEIFNSDNDLLNRFKTNIQIINNYQLNPAIFSEIEEILFMDSNLLEKNLKTLESYNLLKSIKNSTSYSFILNESLELLIDKYLELGYESLLEEDLDILNYNDTRRVEILSNMGIVLEKTEFIEMFEYDKFFIPDEMLDDYIPNKINVSKNSDITIEDLLEFKKTTRTLEINNHIISINKVLRAIENNLSIKEAIYFNMNIDLDTYQEIENELIGQSYIK